jgi:hypothetical protein
VGVFGDLLAALINRLRQLRLLLSGKPDVEEPKGDGKGEKK